MVGGGWISSWPVSAFPEKEAVPDYGRGDPGAALFAASPPSWVHLTYRFRKTESRASPHPRRLPGKKPNFRSNANFVFSETALIRIGAALLARGPARPRNGCAILYFQNQTRSFVDDVVGANAKPPTEESCMRWSVKPGRPAFPSLVPRRDGPAWPPAPSRPPSRGQRENRIAYYANLRRLRDELAGVRGIFRLSKGLRPHRACWAAREEKLLALGGSWPPHLFCVWPDVTPEASEPPS